MQVNSLKEHRVLIIHNPSELKQWRNQLAQNVKVGFVPTMGALHQGHMSLLKAARAESDQVVLSIFVNPTQFNDPKDFEKYPITLEQDLEQARTHNVDLVFLPTKDSMYPDGYAYQVSENQFSKILCGQNRPGHFEGVLTIVLKLLMLVRPKVAFFGEKDFQQMKLIQGMTQSFFLDTEIRPQPTLREKDGLAMSSRNVRLTPHERSRAPEFFKALTHCESPEQATRQLTEQGFHVDYVVDIDTRRFGAVKLGEVRLIDNVEIAP